MTKSKMCEYAPSVLLALALASAPWCAEAAGDLSQIKIGALGSNTSTATANDYYPQTTTSTREFWGPDPAANRPAELKELARALRHDVDLIYEYVHDNIRTVFMYGLQKGALGAMIDQSGTAFDQAHLMVELLRESGYSARYKVGTLQLTAAQANAWLGITNATAIQKIFRDGGIPLNYSSTGPTYTIGHIWVEVTIPGSSCNSSCWFDPAYKSHVFKPPLNLESLMGWGANEFSTSDSSSFLVLAWSGSQPATTPAAPVWVSNLHDGNIQSKLNGYANTLLTNLKSAAHKDKEIEDVVGGQQIVRSGAAGVRNSGTLPGFTASVQRTWVCTGNTTCGIPDPYRTKLTVTMLSQSIDPTNPPPLITKSFFPDEIYGRRVYFDTPESLELPDEGAGQTSFEPWCVRLTVDGTAVPGPGMSAGCAGQSSPAPWERDHHVRLEVDHPYAASSGSYMDLAFSQGTHIQKRADFALPVIIVHGWGDVSAALVSKLAAEQRADRLLPVYDPPGTTEPGHLRGDSSNDHTMVKLGASFLAQYSRMAELQKRMGNSEHVLRHMVGIIYAEATLDSGWGSPENQQTANDWYVQDRAIRINVDVS